MIAITADELICMNDLQGDYSFSVELAYASDNNLLFGERIYRADAKLWLHRDLAEIVCLAARLARERTGGSLVLYDGLRTVDAQERMLVTKRVRENPHWLEPPRLLSTPGTGAHPRGMAIDLALKDASGVLLDMGTPFDFLASASGPDANPAHRNYQSLSATVLANRALLEQLMLEAAAEVGQELFPLPQEWWDYRLPPSVYELYAPLTDGDLPIDMKMS